MSFKFNPFTGKLDKVTTPSGSNTQVQFNDNGVFGASSNFTYNGSNLVVNNGRIINQGTNANIEVKVDTSNVKAFTADTNGTGKFTGYTFQSDNNDIWSLEKDTDDHFNIYDWTNDINVFEAKQDTRELVFSNSTSNATRYDIFFKGYNGASFDNLILRGAGGVELYQNVDLFNADLTINNNTIDTFEHDTSFETTSFYTDTQYKKGQLQIHNNSGNPNDQFSSLGWYNQGTLTFDFYYHNGAFELYENQNEFVAFSVDENNGYTTYNANAIFNNAALDSDFIINKQTSGVAYTYDAGLDTHTFNGVSTINDGLVMGEYLRLANTSDTTNGNLRFSATGDIEGRKAGAWVSLTAGAASAAGSQYNIQTNDGAGFFSTNKLIYRHNDTGVNERLETKGEWWLSHTEMMHSYIDSTSGNISNGLLFGTVDGFRFREIVNQEYWDGASWVNNASDDFTQVLDGVGSTGVNIPAARKRFRIVIDLGSTFFHSSQIAIYQEFSSGTRDFLSVIIDAGSWDGVSFTSAKNMYTSSGTIAPRGGGSDGYLTWIRTSNPDGNRYIQIEIDADITTSNLALRKIELLSQRHSKIPYGNRPYEYNYDRDAWRFKSLRINGDSTNYTALTNSTLRVDGINGRSSVVEFRDSSGNILFQYQDNGDIIFSGNSQVNDNIPMAQQNQGLQYDGSTSIQYVYGQLTGDPIIDYRVFALAPFDMARFIQPEDIEYWDGAAWQTFVTTEAKTITDGLGNTRWNVLAANKRFRFVLDIASFASPSPIIMVQDWGSPGWSEYDYIIESGDTGSWTIRASGTSAGGNPYNLVTLPNTLSGDSKLRIEIDIPALTGAAFRLSNVMVISNRMTNLSPDRFPYAFDADKRFAIGRNTVDTNSSLIVRGFTDDATEKAFTIENNSFVNLWEFYNDGSATNLSNGTFTTNGDIQLNDGQMTIDWSGNTEPLLTLRGQDNFPGTNIPVLRSHGFSISQLGDIAKWEVYNDEPDIIISDIVSIRGESDNDVGGWKMRVTDRDGTLTEMLTTYGTNDGAESFDFFLNNESKSVDYFFKSSTNNWLTYDDTNNRIDLNSPLFINDSVTFSSAINTSDQFKVTNDRGLTSSVDLNDVANHNIVSVGGVDTGDYTSIALALNTTFPGVVLLAEDEGSSQRAGFKIYTNGIAANADLQERFYIDFRGNITLNPLGLDSDFIVKRNGGGDDIINYNGGNQTLELSSSEINITATNTDIEGGGNLRFRTVGDELQMRGSSSGTNSIASRSGGTWNDWTFRTTFDDILFQAGINDSNRREFILRAGDTGTYNALEMNVNGIITISQRVNTNGIVVSRVNTSTTETVDVTGLRVIRQTTSGITTSLSNFVNNQLIIIKNRSGGDCTLNVTVDGTASPTIADGESWQILYNGVDFDLL